MFHTGSADDVCGTALTFKVFEAPLNDFTSNFCHRKHRQRLETRESRKILCDVDIPMFMVTWLFTLDSAGFNALMIDLVMIALCQILIYERRTTENATHG